MKHEHHDDIDKGAQILLQIKESEVQADKILEDARKQKEDLISEANSDAQKMLDAGIADIAKQNDKKIIDFRSKASLLKDDKLSLGKANSKLLKSKSDKNIGKASDFIVKKFEEMI